MYCVSTYLQYYYSQDILDPLLIFKTFYPAAIMKATYFLPLVLAAASAAPLDASTIIDAGMDQAKGMAKDALLKYIDDETGRGCKWAGSFILTTLCECRP